MEALHLFLLGEQQRKVGETKLNLNSSRSHIIFSLRCIRIDVNGSPSRINTLSLVDLAGSERQVNIPHSACTYLLFMLFPQSSEISKSIICINSNDTYGILIG